MATWQDKFLITYPVGSYGEHKYKGTDPVSNQVMFYIIDNYGYILRRSIDELSWENNSINNDGTTKFNRPDDLVMFDEPFKIMPDEVKLALRFYNQYNPVYNDFSKLSAEEQINKFACLFFSPSQINAKKTWPFLTSAVSNFNTVNNSEDKRNLICSTVLTPEEMKFRETVKFLAQYSAKSGITFDSHQYPFIMIFMMSRIYDPGYSVVKNKEWLVSSDLTPSYLKNNTGSYVSSAPLNPFIIPLAEPSESSTNTDTLVSVLNNENIKEVTQPKSNKTILALAALASYFILGN